MDVEYLMARKIYVHTNDDELPITQGQDKVWRIRSYRAAQALLRCTNTKQAGLGIDAAKMLPPHIKRPIIFQDGLKHREQRRQTAPYFTRQKVVRRYHSIIVNLAEKYVGEIKQSNLVDLSDLSTQMATSVAAEVLGLVNGPPGLHKRIERFLSDKYKPGFYSPLAIYALFRNIALVVDLYWRDIRPSVKYRCTTPQDDLITHLIKSEATIGEIIGECLTFTIAGMVTTRDFINVAAWHLFTDEKLKRRYIAAYEEERHALLYELVRLEPSANLKRRTTAPVKLPCGQSEITIPEDSLVEVILSTVNIDPKIMGKSPLAICGSRAKVPGRFPGGLSFGDGAHKCPGEHLAIREADAFLFSLFSIKNLQMIKEPAISTNKLLGTYRINKFMVGIL
ncbi:cytochrome P450 [Streptomyces sp. NPDC086783]|uniref:cytochrome P450 n=1 Tax=Streptomyces sp. NPDC086783 TaxID=3365758 RepID=UPI00382B170E